MAYGPEKKQEVFDLLARGVSQAQIVRDTGVSKSAVKRWKGAWIAAGGLKGVEEKDPSAQGSTQGAQKEPTRNPNGTWRKGVSGNPGGSSSAVEFADKLAKESAAKIMQARLARLEAAWENIESKKVPINPDHTSAFRELRELEKEMLAYGMGRPSERKHAEDGGEDLDLDMEGIIRRELGGEHDLDIEDVVRFPEELESALQEAQAKADGDISDAG